MANVNEIKENETVKAIVSSFSALDESALSSGLTRMGAGDYPVLKFLAAKSTKIDGRSTNLALFTDGTRVMACGASKFARCFGKIAKSEQKSFFEEAKGRHYHITIADVENPRYEGEREITSATLLTVETPSGNGDGKKKNG